MCALAEGPSRKILVELALHLSWILIVMIVMFGKLHAILAEFLDLTFCTGWCSFQGIITYIYLPIYPPFSWIHLLMHFGILAINLSKTSGEICPQAEISYISSVFRFVSGSKELMAVWIIDHRFSIGFRSGELVGQIPLGQKF